MPMNLCTFRNNFSEPAVVNAPHRAVARGVLQDFVKVLAVGVGDEDLAEVVAGHHLHDSLHAAGIKFVEYIVEQQQRGDARGFLEEIILREPQGDGI